MKKLHLAMIAAALTALVIASAASSTPAPKPGFTVASASLTGGHNDQLACSFTETNLTPGQNDVVNCSGKVKWVLACAGDNNFTFTVSVNASKKFNTGSGEIDGSINLNHGAQPGNHNQCTVSSADFEGVQVSDGSAKKGVAGKFYFVGP
jgi:hypothetical protein